MNNWQPTGVQLLVRAVSVEETTASGIVIPDSAMKTKHAIIEKIGGRVPRTSFSAGDEIVFIPEQAFPVVIPGETDLFVLPYPAVLIHKRNRRVPSEVI